MLLQLEQECLDIYRTKVERSRKYKAELQRSLAEFEAEIAQLTSALGERVSAPRVCSQSSFLFGFVCGGRISILIYSLFFQKDAYSCA